MDTTVILAQPRENKAPSGCRLRRSAGIVGHPRISRYCPVPEISRVPPKIVQISLFYTSKSADKVRIHPVYNMRIWPLRTRFFFISESSHEARWGAHALHLFGPHVGTPLGVKNALGCQMAPPATVLSRNKCFCVVFSYTNGARALLVNRDFFGSCPVLGRRVGTAYCQNSSIDLHFLLFPFISFYFHSFPLICLNFP